MELKPRLCQGEALLEGATPGMRRRLKLNLVIGGGTWKVDKVHGQE